MSKRALVLVDLQNDFMPGGALAVEDGDQTVDFANGIMGGYDFVVATQDWHPRDHGSFAVHHPGRNPGDMIELCGLPQVLWPVHCVQGTTGASFHSSLDVGHIDAVVRKGQDPNVDSYSGFFDNGGLHDSGMGNLLRGRGVDSVDVMGLATDYCVQFTVLDALKEGFRVRLLVEGSRGVELQPGDVKRALGAMEAAGAALTSDPTTGA